ncbi:hypothetical protein CDAR_181671 [Caerostris darwini]|uniref:Uncharacterized protein n=1 Tax=Caerostris darwini TaxID=1538125 RepID=A0AAV4URJ3_9ARAC|nr:hypothetical protein CDAR_181671 [Caerostris darwini]
MEGIRYRPRNKLVLISKGLRHSTEQLDKHKKLFLQVKETYQAVVKNLPKDEEYNAVCSKKLQGLLTSIEADGKQKGSPAERCTVSADGTVPIPRHWMAESDGVVLKLSHFGYIICPLRQISRKYL